MRVIGKDRFSICEQQSFRRACAVSKEPTHWAHNVKMTSYHVASALIRRHFDVMYLLGMLFFLSGRPRENVSQRTSAKELDVASLRDQASCALKVRFDGMSGEPFLATRHVFYTICYIDKP